MVTIKVENLIDFVADVFAHAESSAEEARRIATYLTTANLTGHDSHGVIRVPVYIRWKKMGSVVPNQTAEVVVDTPSFAVVDGKKLPKGPLIDPDGTLSEDPTLIYGPHTADGPRDHSQGKGAIRAFGEHKGSGLALICELLGGALTGTGATSPNRRFANGMLAIYVDPKVVDTSSFFDGEISRYVSYFKDTKPAAGVDAVLIPGEPEAKMRAERTKNGVPLPDDTWAAIVNTAREVGVSEGSIQRATA